jgi:hypothetical protein
VTRLRYWRYRLRHPFGQSYDAFLQARETEKRMAEIAEHVVAGSDISIFNITADERMVVTALVAKSRHLAP